MKKVAYILGVLSLFVVGMSGCVVNLQLEQSSPYDRVWRMAPQYDYGEVFTIPMHGERVPVVMVYGVGETTIIARQRAYHQGIRNLGSNAQIVSRKPSERTRGGLVMVRYIMAIPTET